MVQRVQHDALAALPSPPALHARPLPVVPAPNLSCHQVSTALYLRFFCTPHLTGRICSRSGPCATRDSRLLMQQAGGAEAQLVGLQGACRCKLPCSLPGCCTAQA
jgi:hypothetical protein